MNAMTIDQYAAVNKIKRSVITTIADLKAKAAAGKVARGFIAMTADDFNALNPTELGMLGNPATADLLCHYVIIKNGKYKQFVTKYPAVTRFVNNVREA